VVVDREGDPLHPDVVAGLGRGGVDDGSGLAQVADPRGHGVGGLVAGHVVLVVEHRLHGEVTRLHVVVGDAGVVQDVDHLLGAVADGGEHVGGGRPAAGDPEREVGDVG